MALWGGGGGYRIDQTHSQIDNTHYIECHFTWDLYIKYRLTQLNQMWNFKLNSNSYSKLSAVRYFEANFDSLHQVIKLLSYEKYIIFLKISSGPFEKVIFS